MTFKWRSNGVQMTFKRRLLARKARSRELEDPGALVLGEVTPETVRDCLERKKERKKENT